MRLMCRILSPDRSAGMREYYYHMFADGVRSYVFVASGGCRVSWVKGISQLFMVQASTHQPSARW